MTKDNSRRSSIAAPSPEPEQSGEASSNVGDAANSDVELQRAAPAESQPLTASNSISSNPSTVYLSGEIAAPYGTRSRNRNGNPRPNYAEDKELDAEFEVTVSGKDNAGRKQARGSELGPANMDIGRTTNTARKNGASEGEQVGTAQNHFKEPIPGTSTFSANPSSSQSSKKRKATGQPTATAGHDSQLQVPSQGMTTAQVVTRRASMAAQVVGGFRDSNMLSFSGCGGRLKGKRLVADDGTILEVNDHVYLVCEPPGEPYYLGRIMEFLHINNDSAQPIDALRLNWYYRPKDIGRKVNDTRQVFASMHSDISPLTALRGKCQIKHKSEVEKLDDLRKTKDCFWYEKLYDRYIHRFYDVIPTSQVINVPVEVKKVLDERWRYIIVEPGRGKELTSAVKSCKRCNKYCASNDSVDCAVCRNTYHMSCVNPPLLKKPSRGFAWACGPCSKAQEKKLEARNTPNMNGTITDAEEDELVDEDDDFSAGLGDPLETGRTSPTVSSEAAADVSIHPGTAEQIHQASLWLFRYLGIHCKVEDALDYDDRIYPRASSRLGPRHQANVTLWPGRPVEYVKPTEIKKKYIKGGSHKKDAKLSKETIAALEADKIERDKRPKWVMDEPPGYVHRGEDLEHSDPSSTSKLLFTPPEPTSVPERAPNSGSEQEYPPDQEQFMHDYMARAKRMAKSLGLPELSTNLLDVALNLLLSNGYDTEKALQELSTIDKKTFKEPELSPAELKKFEDGVAKFGSEWHSIKKHVKSVSPADIVRFYYTWKKTERGKQIWGNFSGRKGKKEAKKVEQTAGKLQDDVADEYDDSAFDNDKAFEKKKGFQCKFCATRSSRQWRRAPNTLAGAIIPDSPNNKLSGKDKGTQLMIALCRRCAELWRRYAIQWEDVDEVAKKVAQAGGRAWKRKIDEELLKELQAANEGTNQGPNGTLSGPVSTNGTPGPAPLGLSVGPEPPRKKMKGAIEPESTDPALETGGGLTAGQQKKKTVIEKPHVPPPPPEPPKPKILPCAVCGEMEPIGDQHLSCRDCRMTVHRNCYGVVGEGRSPGKWVCDMCSNDKNPQVSVQYKCVLCPVEYTEQDFVEPPKISHKKKTEKDRERDRLERENAQKVADFFRKKQEEMNKPVNPREPLKRTANNNWVHVTCAVFTPEVRFGNAKALEPSEGIPSISSARYEEVCKACKETGGACVSCHSCRASVHVECAHQAGYILGFDITPVKGSRRDQVTTVDIHGEVGTMAAAIWCKEHAPTKTIVHRMNDPITGTGLNALQLFVQNFKQADLALTGTVRKATLLNQSTKVINQVSMALPPNRRSSTTVTSINGSSTGRGSLSHANVKIEDGQGSISKFETGGPEKTCITCGIDVSPRWYPVHQKNIAESGDALIPANGVHDTSPRPDGTTASDAVVENGGVHIALAVAALHQDTRKATPIPTEFQCHQCHSKKKCKEPSPSPASPERAASSPPSTAPPTASVPPVATDMLHMISHYRWPQPPSQPPAFPSSTSYGNWPRQSPAPQAAPQVNRLNGSHSPRINNAPLQHPNGQQTVPGQSVSLSPRQNGQVGQVTNGYPPSPHRVMSSSGLHMQNGTYNTYPRPAAQHLTNGGPFGLPHGSPPLRESHSQGRDAGDSQNNNPRPNLGASSSPSLRNLLS